jgi:predicted transcriptional regulator
MSWNTISFKKLLEITAEDLDVIKENLGIVYGDKTIPAEVRYSALANAFATIEKWSDYYSRYKEVQDSELDKLNRDNAILLQDNNRLHKEVKELREKYNKQSSLLGEANAKTEYLNELIKHKDNSSNLVSIDLVEMLNKLETIANSYELTTKAAEHKAAMKTFNGRVASGEVKPAKRADISDDYIIENYNNNVSAYKIAQSVGMTQQAILYRIKKLKEAGLIE